LTYYRDVRHRFNHTLTVLEQSGVKRIVIFGVRELAELAYLSIQESNLVLVGFIADGPGDRFLSFPRGTLDSVKEWNFDAILISDLGNVSERAKLCSDWFIWLATFVWFIWFVWLCS